MNVAFVMNSKQWKDLDVRFDNAFYEALSTCERRYGEDISKNDRRVQREVNRIRDEVRERKEQLLPFDHPNVSIVAYDTNADLLEKIAATKPVIFCIDSVGAGVANGKVTNVATVLWYSDTMRYSERVTDKSEIHPGNWYPGNVATLIR